MARRKILLVSSDLLASSRLAGVARGQGDVLDVASPAAVPATGAYDLVLIDLQTTSDPGPVITSCRQAAPTGAVIVFGPHVWKDRLDAAVRAGADAAVSRGEVVEGLAAVLERFSRRE